MYVKDTSAGISYRDVRDLAREVERAHFGHIEFHMDLPVRKEASYALNVSVLFTRGGGDHNRGSNERRIAGIFPSNRAATFAGELFRLLYELDARLTEDLEEAQRVHQAALGI